MTLNITKEEQTALMNFLHRDLQKQSVKRKFDLQLNDDKICWYCKRKINSLIPDNPVHKSYFCSYFCYYVFIEEISFMKTKERNDTINILPFEYLQKSSKKKIHNFIDSIQNIINKDTKFIIDYFVLDNENNYKQIKLYIKVINLCQIVLEEKLILDTLILQTEDSIKHFKIDNYEKFGDKDMILENNKCIYCNDQFKLSNDEPIMIELNKHVYLGHFCSLFCALISLTLNNKHIYDKKLFYRFPNFQYINKNSFVYILDLKKNINYKKINIFNSIFNEKTNSFLVSQNIYNNVE